MATALSALRMMRKFCLSLPDSSEADHFGEACFKIGKRIFASCGEKDGVCRIVVQLEPKHASQLVATDKRFQAYGRQANCVSINAADIGDWTEVQTLVLESYHLNSAENRPTKSHRKSKRTKSRKNE